ncbi:MAG: hypothetical protein D6806_05055 [Deltaproteobacteria bacterium]|nr:MAG: hypothetical protein D6806_05055 [Deltaproteobacteria bacterium]
MYGEFSKELEEGKPFEPERSNLAEGSTMTASEFVWTYIIDAQDVIIGYSENFPAFADENQWSSEI